MRSGNDGDGTGKEVISHFMLVTPRLSKSFKTRVYSHITCAIKKKRERIKMCLSGPKFKVVVLLLFGVPDVPHTLQPSPLSHSTAHLAK